MAFVRVVAGTLLLAHGLVHLLYLVPDVTPFSTQRSWLVPQEARHAVAVTLIAAIIVSSAGLAMAVWGVPGLAAAWRVVAVLAGGLSLVLLVAYWDTQLIVGVAIDVTMVTLALVQPGWLKDFLT